MRFRDDRPPQDDESHNGEDKPNGVNENPPPTTATLCDRIAHFTWPWFACTMSTGALAVVLGTTPHTFDGLQVIGTIFFIFDLVLFLLFTAIIATRFILVPAKLWASLHHPVESLFFGSYWVSISLILNCIQIYGVPSAGPWLVKALEILFWIYCAVVLLVGIFQYYVLFQEERLDVSSASPAWVLPIYPLLVVGTLAGTILPSQPHYAATRIWIGAVMLQGLGWCVAFLMYSMYSQRLMTSTLPDPPTRPGMYMSVGPAAYTAAGLISLGNRATSVLTGDYFSITTIPVGDVVKIIGILSGFFLILLAFWFFCLSTVAVVLGVRRMNFTLNWWAFVFPNAGLTLAAIQAGSVLDSAGIDGICSALTIALVIMWLITAVAHIRALWLGRLLWPGKDEDKTMKGIRWGAYAA